jgi:predicted nucleic acid-binding protein
LKFLLDTNVISELRKKDRAHPNVMRWSLTLAVEDICTSVLVLAEIRRGIELKRRNDPAQAKALDHWYTTMRSGFENRVLPITEPVCETWSKMSVPDPLPLIDGLLAATAKVHTLTLVTRNTQDIAHTGVTLLDPFHFTDA